MSISCVDLFCGAGGLTHGFVKEGLPVVAGIDLDSACRYPYEQNNKSIFNKFNQFSHSNLVLRCPGPLGIGTTTRNSSEIYLGAAE